MMVACTRMKQELLRNILKEVQIGVANDRGVLSEK